MKSLTFEWHISRPIKVLIVFFAVALFAVGIYLPLTREQDALAAQILAARKNYREAVMLASQYRVAESRRAEAGKALQGRLFPYLEQVTRELGLEKKIGSIRPERRTDREGNALEAVNVAFKGITLNEFISFLYHIEVLKREIYMQAISIKKDGQNNLIVQMTLQKFV